MASITRPARAVEGATTLGETAVTHQPDAAPPIERAIGRCPFPLPFTPFEYYYLLEGSARLSLGVSDPVAMPWTT